MSALVSIIVMEEDRGMRLERQLKTEEGKAAKGSTEQGRAAKKQESAKVATLKREVDRVHTRVSALTERVGALFEVIVVERCRDEMAFIRRDVMEAVGQWSLLCPAKFMHDTYMKYLAWGMSDKVCNIICACSASHQELGTFEAHDC
jgi:hypothetical protein